MTLRPKYKTRYILIGLAIIAIVVRALLPIIIEQQVNKAIAINPNISGGIDDVDLWLLSGRASLQGLLIEKAEADIPAPIVKADKVAFSISWKALLSGGLYGDIQMYSPELNIVDGKSEQQSQSGAEIDWRRALTSFYPFEINKITIENGEVHFRNFTSVPPVDLYLERINASASNITNDLVIEDSNAAQISLTATTIGGGEVTGETSFNLVRAPARGSIMVDVSGLDVTSLNDFARAYGNLDLQEGKFSSSLKLEILEDGSDFALEGELLPVINNLNVLKWKEDVEVQHDPSFILAWEGLVDAAKWLLESGPQDRIESKIPIAGSLKNPDIGVVQGVWSTIKNALIGRFTPPKERILEEDDSDAELVSPDE